LFAPAPPAVAVELAQRRLTVVEIGGGRKPSVVGYASEALPDEALQPGLSGVNIPDIPGMATTLRRALERAGIRASSRAALVVPDSVARVSLITLEQMPSRPADVEQLIRWHLKKATPFPMDEAQVTWFVAHRETGSVTLAATVGRRDVIAQYEAVAAEAGLQAGLVDLASINVLNAVVGAGGAPASDWLLVSLAPEATTLAIGRGADLMFYRHRATVEDEPLGALVHQMAMYHEDRLGGGRFSRVWLCGGGVGAAAEQARRDIGGGLGVPVEAVDVRAAAELGARSGASPEVLDALAAPVGVLLRDRKAA
jgi:Tfp pilus assembly PilM family ATPase